MPFVRRDNRIGEGKYFDWVYWGDMSKAEKIRAKYRLASYAVVIPSLIATFAWGENDQQKSHEDQKAQPIAEATAIYADAAIADKYTYSFLSPIRTESDSTHDEGIGIAEAKWDKFKRSYVMVGRTCLRDTAYDITGDDDKEGTAALSASGTSVTVYPNGTDAPALQFMLGENGVLNPDGRTADTLEAYNCSYLSEVPVRSAFKKDSGYFEWDMWQIEEPIK